MRNQSAHKRMYVRWKIFEYKERQWRWWWWWWRWRRQRRKPIWSKRSEERETLNNWYTISTQYTFVSFTGTTFLLFSLAIFVAVIVVASLAITSSGEYKSKIRREHRTECIGTHTKKRTHTHNSAEQQQHKTIRLIFWNAAARTFCDFSTHVFVSFVFRSLFSLLFFFVFLSFSPFSSFIH